MGVTFQAIRNEAHNEAGRVRVTQAEMIRLGDRAYSHADAERRAEIWEKCALVMDVILSDDVVRSRILGALREPGAGQRGAATP
jgi:hypothetical protein